MAENGWQAYVRARFDLSVAYLDTILPNFQFGEARNSIDLWIGEFVLLGHRDQFLALLATISEQPLVALQKSLRDKKRVGYQAQSGA